MSYTKGPWKEAVTIDGGFEIQSGNFVVASRNGYREWDRKEESKANARRIVACVNACEGIPTEALECQTKKQLTTKMIAERDKLLEALEAIVSHETCVDTQDRRVIRIPEGVMHDLRALIQKAKGVL